MKIFKTFWLVLIALSFAGNASAVDYWAQVYKQTTNNVGAVVLEEVNTGVTYQVLDAGTDTVSTLTEYNDDTSTSKTNPVTTTVYAVDAATAHAVQFRNTASTVDLVITDTNGCFSEVIDGFTKYQHKIVINEAYDKVHNCVIWWTGDTTDEKDTGVDFLADTAITHVLAEVVTVSAGNTIDVGLLSTEGSGDANGFIAAGSIAAAAFVDPRKPTITAAGTETYVSTAAVVGALMGSSLAGSPVATDEGSAYYWDHIVLGTNATSLSYTPSSTTSTPAGYFYIQHRRLR